MPEYTGLAPQKDNSAGKILRAALMLAAPIETILTAKASKGQYVGKTSLDMLKGLDAREAEEEERRAKALERRLREDETKANTKRADGYLDLQKKADGRAEARYQAEEDEQHRKVIDKDKLSQRMLAPPTTYDQESNTVTMGRGIRFPRTDAKGEQLWEGDAPAYDYPTQADRILIERDPIGWLSEKMKAPKPETKKWVQDKGGAWVQLDPDGPPVIGRTPATPGAGGPGAAPAGYRWAKDGSLEYVPGGPADPAVKVDNKPPTEDQSKAANFARRMELAMHDLAELEKAGFDRSSSAAAARSGPLVPNALNSKEGQRYTNAEKNFASANLRKESGAVIGRDEMLQQEELYFPRHGDSPETIAQKARNRAQAFAGMRAAAGSLFDKIPSMVPKAAGGMDRKALARQALNDPEATPEERAQAQKILAGP